MRCDFPFRKTPLRNDGRRFYISVLSDGLLSDQVRVESRNIIRGEGTEEGGKEEKEGEG